MYCCGSEGNEGSVGVPLTDCGIEHTHTRELPWASAGITLCLTSPHKHVHKSNTLHLKHVRKYKLQNTPYVQTAAGQCPHTCTVWSITHTWNSIMCTHTYICIWPRVDATVHAYNRKVEYSVNMCTKNLLTKELLSQCSPGFSGLKCTPWSPGQPFTMIRWMHYKHFFLTLWCVWRVIRIIIMGRAHEGTSMNAKGQMRAA